MSNEALEQAENTIAAQRQRLNDVEADETYAFTALIGACQMYDEVRQRWVDTGHDSYYNELKMMRARIWLNAHDMVKRGDD